MLYLDLNVEKYQTPEIFGQVMRNYLSGWEKEYGIEPEEDNIAVRFREIIKTACEKTGERVVILVDEYDKPLVSNLHDDKMFEFYRNELAALYSNFKSSADYIRIVFLTGVSRFGHLSVFSGLNNIMDISFDDRYSDVCGITEDELRAYFDEGISSLSVKYNKTTEEVCRDIRKWYDGYCFSGFGKDIYNPFSVVCLMESEVFMNYWIHSGQATLLKEQIRHFNVDLESLFNTVCDIEELRGLDLENPRPVALLYQTGYLTIKSYEDELYRLGLPNREVKQGFLLYLLPYYVDLHNLNARFVVQSFVRELNSGDVDAFMERLKSMFSSVPYDMKMECEQNLHNALLILMILLGLNVRTEYRTSNGRIDLFIQTAEYYYIIELKLDRTAREALDQINSKDYALPFVCSGKKIVKIGVNFSTSSRTISEWIVQFQ